MQNATKKATLRLLMYSLFYAVGASGQTWFCLTSESDDDYKSPDQP